ncbi:MAG: dephospho-CoA kinase [Bacteroidales bacterium]|jgi:dephospho-CoA kinase
MLKVGLTGNIGSGKSIISEVFSTLGVPIYHADKESRDLLLYPGVKEEVLDLLGNNILNVNKEIDRPKVAAIVFSDKDALMKLNAILHPRVILDFLNWCEVFAGQPYVIQEAAIIYESRVESVFDKIIHVSCPDEIAIQRVMKRDGTEEKLVLQRMQFQMKDEVKASLADYVILNDGKEMVIPQVMSIHEKLKELSIQY